MPMHLSVFEARTLSEGILVRHGFSPEDAALISEVLIEAHLWGRPTSGLSHLLSVVRAGDRQPVRIVREDSRSALIDGGNNPGFLVASRAMRIAIAKAKAGGIASVAARNAYFGGINGYYVGMAARQDLIALMSIASGERVAPAGGIDPLFGTNPFAVAIPTLGEPVILDMSTSSTNLGGLQRAERLNQPLRPGLAIGPDGEPTTDPKRALQGAILPFGGHKGSGLAMIVQCLGILGGGAIIPRGTSDFGYFMLVIDPSSFMPVDEYKARVSELVERVRSVRPGEGTDRVRTPGERSQAERSRRLREGFDIDEALYNQLLAL